jgi:hypothetical protein
MIIIFGGFIHWVDEEEIEKQIMNDPRTDEEFWEDHKHLINMVKDVVKALEAPGTADEAFKRMGEVVEKESENKKKRNYFKWFRKPKDN